MSDTNAQEPTMEEILASIRRIISEDDAPKAEAAAQPEPANEEPEIEEEPAIPDLAALLGEGDEEDDVLELTDPEPESAPAPLAAAETLGDLDITPAAPAPAPRAAPSRARQDEDEGLISPPTADLAASAFGHLTRTLAMPASDRTLEGVVRDLLRPLLKTWLDEHLPGIVEAAVEAEVQRISRMGR